MIAPFDSNWQGPEELKPRCYRSQSEKDTWHAVAVENEYRLPELGADDVVIDIGANIGSFAHLAYRQGSRSIYAFELEQYNYEGALENLRGLDDGVALYRCAVVRGDRYRGPEYFANGSWNTFGKVGEPVPARSLDEILEPHERVRFLKIDVEGCEWPILYTCTQLRKVDEIAGEYHLVPQDADELQNLPHDVSLNALEQFLQDNGFNTQFKQNSPTTGNFWAWQRRDGDMPDRLRKRLLAMSTELREIADRIRG